MTQQLEPPPAPLVAVQHAFRYGKHAGKRLDQLPDGYLAWMVSTWKMSKNFRAAVAAELRRRVENELAKSV